MIYVVSCRRFHGGVLWGRMERHCHPHSVTGVASICALRINLLIDTDPALTKEPRQARFPSCRSLLVTCLDCVSIMFSTNIPLSR